MLRILLVEDDADRFKIIESWMPLDARLVWVSDGGSAFGVLRRDKPDTYAGVMLDFDLDKRRLDTSGPAKTGRDVAQMMTTRVANHTPVLVHSMNPAQRQEAIALLRNAGFPVTQVPFAELTREKFLEWVGEVRVEHTE